MKKLTSLANKIAKMDGKEMAMVIGFGITAITAALLIPNAGRLANAHVCLETLTFDFTFS